MASPPRPVVICGPSGVGKGTIITKLMVEFPDTFGFSVSHTTRGPRPGEENGVHYHFAEKSVMETQIANGEFLEHARVHENIYGTSVQSVKSVSEQNKICILDIDVQGAEIVKKSDLNAIFLFVSPPSIDELEKRLRRRGTEKEDSIVVRMANATKEMAKTEEAGFFDNVIVNDDLEKAYVEIKKAILG